MSKLRKSARGQDCLVRIPGHCNHNPETTVLGHLAGGGMGAKVPDLFSAFVCYNCHGVLDGHIKSEFTRDELKLMHLEGMVRTQQYWLDEGLIHA